MITPELLSNFESLVTTILPSVSLSLSEAVNEEVQLVEPMTSQVTSANLQSSFTEPQLLVQFTIGDSDTAPQALIFSPETLGDFATKLMDPLPEEVDESVLAGIRPALEAIVQGICAAASMVRDESYIATKLSIKNVLPDSNAEFTSYEDLAVMVCTIECASIKGTMTWVVSPEGLQTIAGKTEFEEPEVSAENIFDSISEDAIANQATPAPAAFTPSAPSADNNGLELLLDIPLEISVELGRVKMPVRDVVDLGAGSIVEIDKAAGEPVDVLVNGRLVARGEVVVIEDNFGVRITEILSPYERLQRLNEAA